MPMQSLGSSPSGARACVDRNSEACAPELHTRASWGGSARARGPVREGGDLGHARGARGRPVARLACRSARSALFEPVSRSSSSETSTLRRSVQSAWPTRTRPRRELRPRCPIIVAPSRWRLPAQAASAKSEAQRGGHGGWPTAWATRGDAACRAAWLGKHLGSLEAPRSGIAPTRLGRSKSRVGCFAGPSRVFAGPSGVF